MHRPTHICIARHGETDWNAAGILQGWIDVPINEKGRLQAVELGESLAGRGFSCIYSSPLRRARETAEMIAGRLELPVPSFHDGLKERHFGRYQGVPKEELAVTHPEVLEEIRSRNPAGHFEGGESMDHFADRVIHALGDIADLHEAEAVLVVTHGWVMDVITRHVKGLPRDTVLNMKRKNIECLWLDVADGEIREMPPPGW
ncbi:MAG TPA: histidine phosphatase family protein [Rhodocyclaceae bacterium]|nr:histidine phosphatase family protein [Rhodocyclaceae bacterium]